MRLSTLVARSIRPAVAATLMLFGLTISGVRAETAAQQPRSAEQLEQLVAPIALYPDALLSQVLMASTYPLEVWVRYDRPSSVAPDVDQRPRSLPSSVVQGSLRLHLVRGRDTAVAAV